MPRVDEWEDRLNEVIAKHQALPNDYAVSNCYIIPDDAVEAITGARMHPKGFNGRNCPKTERGALVRMRKHGFANVLEAFAAKFEEIPVSLAQRGDIGVIDRHGMFHGGVFTSIGFFTRSDDGITFVPPSEVYKAFKVE